MKNILVITYWSYKEGLIQSYTLPYLYIISKYLKGGKIFLVTLEKQDLKLNEQEQKAAWSLLESNQIQHVPLKYRALSIKGALSWIIDLFNLSMLIKMEKINKIHAWCTPGGMIGVILSKLWRIPLVLDSFEPHAEAMVENGTWTKRGLPFRIMFYFEKLQVREAGHVIATTPGMYDYTKTKYNHEIQSFYVKPACVDMDRFKPGERDSLRNNIGINGEITCVYAGKLGGIYLDREVFDLFKRASVFWKDNFKVLLLTDQNDEEIESLIKATGLDPKVVIKRFVPFREINTYIAAADFGITPVKPVPSKKYCTPIKDGEYWASGLPVIISRNISIDSEIIEQNDIGYVLKEFSREEYDNAIRKMAELLNRPGLDTSIREVAKKERSFEIAEKIYRTIYG